MRLLAVLALAAVALASPALAQAPGTITVKDGNSAALTVAGQTDAGSAFHYRDVMEGVASGVPNAVLVSSDGLLHASVDNVASVVSPIIPVTVTPNITAGAYATAGFVVGGKLTLTGFARVSGGKVLVQSVTLADLTANPGPVDIVYFGANPSASTFTDHAAFTVNAADVPKIQAVVHITDWTATGDPVTGSSFGQAQNLAAPVSIASGTTAWAVIVARGTPTFGSTTDLTLTSNQLQQ